MKRQPRKILALHVCIFHPSVALALSLSLASCVTTSVPSPTYKVGDTVEGAVTLGSRIFPLEPGRYVVAGVAQSESGTSNVSGTTTSATLGAATILHVTLFKIENKKIVNAVSVEGNVTAVQRVSPGWIFDKECERKDLHFVSKASNITGAVDCYWVNHLTTVYANRQPVAQQAIDYATANQLEYPVFYLGVGYSFSDTSDYAKIRYMFIPEVEGRQSLTDTRWEGSDWHRDRIARDPKRVEYMNKVISWAQSWYPKVKASFNRQWRPTMTNAPASSAPLSPQRNDAVDDVKQQLQTLKKLLDDGLITPSDYEVQKKRLLERI